MASKFEIHINRPQHCVRMFDDDQDETTNWISLPRELRQQDDNALVAWAYTHSDTFHDMVVVAQRVAYAVYLGEEHFDIHQVTPAWAKAALDRARAQLEGVALDKTTRPVNSSPPARRM